MMNRGCLARSTGVDRQFTESIRLGETKAIHEGTGKKNKKDTLIAYMPLRQLCFYNFIHQIRERFLPLAMN